MRLDAWQQQAEAAHEPADGTVDRDVLAPERCHTLRTP